MSPEEKPFVPLDLGALARWIAADLEVRPTVLGIPRANFAVPGKRLWARPMGRLLTAPLGVAAGPHTQLAQNIVSAWLCGARFMELKTVQVQDEIHVPRPCIDSEDVTYNCEWSQELKLEQSFDEYLKAWVLVHALSKRLGLESPGVHFAMSVGYDLAGIQSERVQRFISRMRSAPAEVAQAAKEVFAFFPELGEVEVPSRLSDHITLSTMHGCPPAEIERIARYLLTELKVHTWVKLNPTLLGPERLRELLNQTQGFDVEVPDAAFEHDPKFDDAIRMVKNLAELAKGKEQTFGVKLSNTLEVSNRRRVFPPTEKTMYLSGRALHPLTLVLAQQVTEAVGGEVPISFCGGADATNFAELVADGLGPVTVCTDLLKPGGYARLQEYLANLELAMDERGATSLEEFVGPSTRSRGNLERHARRVLGDRRYAERARPLSLKGSRTLGHFDCIAAPCQEACPAHQNIPDYLWLVAQGRAAEASEVIQRTNAMPAVTGSVCDHPCTDRCIRNYYDRPLAIREVKRFAVETSPPPAPRAAPARGVKVAVVGGGPGGLAAASMLAEAGFAVSLFEAKNTLGGMVSGAIPSFRLAKEAVDADVQRAVAAGVELRLGVRLGEGFTVETLQRDGFAFVVLAVGAQAGKRLGISGEGASGVFDALDFLHRVRAGEKLALGKRVLVVGGGNSAMDAARTARRLAPEGGVVELVYRRTRGEMPADPEEVQACLDEGVRLRTLVAPVRAVEEGGRVVGLLCQRMKLGEPDASGRPRPVPVEGALETLECDTLIPAISQEPVLNFFGGLECSRNRDGTLKVDPKSFETSQRGVFAIGDVVRGPSSIIWAIADGQAVARELIRRHEGPVPSEPFLDKRRSPEALLSRRARTSQPLPLPPHVVKGRLDFGELVPRLEAAVAAAEADRCLHCDDLCSLCVTVCPNRANQAYESPALELRLPVLVARGGQLEREAGQPFRVEQAVQTFNVIDFCNRCGNCTPFCPTAGQPFLDKPRFWLNREAFAESREDCFHMARKDGVLLLEAKRNGQHVRLACQGSQADYTDGRVHVRLRREGWELLDARPTAKLGEGERIDLGPCAELIALLGVEPALLVREE